MPFYYAILLMFVTHWMQPDVVMPTDIETYLQEGLNLEQQGEPEQSLILWQQAIDELVTPSVAIATEYLRVATQYELRDYYPSANEAYRWGMSGYNPEAMQIKLPPAGGGDQQNGAASGTRYPSPLDPFTGSQQPHAAGRDVELLGTTEYPPIHTFQ